VNPILQVAIIRQEHLFSIIGRKGVERTTIDF
jgi:hypothetical protein